MLEEMKTTPSSVRKIQNLKVEIILEGLIGEEGLLLKSDKASDMLPEVLSELQDLRWLNWIEPCWATHTTIQSLASLPLLSKITICHSGWQPKVIDIPPIYHFRNGTLESLSIFHRTGTDYAHVHDYISTISIVLAHNLHMSHLELSLPACRHFEVNPLPFAELFRLRSIPQTLQLRSLTLRGWRIELTPEVISHLQSLHSLEILDEIEAHSPEFWRVLQIKNIHPRRITAFSPNSNLLDYLETSSGLEALKFLDHSWLSEEESEQLAQRFYRTVLPKHKATLRELSVLSGGPDPWNIKGWNLDVLDGYRELRFLEVEIWEDDIHATSDPEKHILGALVKRLAALPNFQTLTVYPAFNGREGGGMTFIADGIWQMGKILESMKLNLGETSSLMRVCIYGSHGVHVPEIEGEDTNVVKFKFVFET
ncbi:hypothetical protein L218DRAFT_560800 [Marasmius fiardii PR-910]|nr:hypothetical protein L218DRAFT_560800 [Marasmius fiardii PR-910]